MIDRAHQRKGYGRATLVEVIRRRRLDRRSRCDNAALITAAKRTVDAEPAP
jgi:hypothetical protein